MPETRHVQVAKFSLETNPVNMTRRELDSRLFEVGRRSGLLANMFVSDWYNSKILGRTNPENSVKPRTISQLNKHLQGVLEKEREEWKQTAKVKFDSCCKKHKISFPEVAQLFENHLWDQLELHFGKKKKAKEAVQELKLKWFTMKKAEKEFVFAKVGALPSSVTDVVYQNRIKPQTSSAVSSDILQGKRSLPTFRCDSSVVLRCDLTSLPRLEKTKEGHIELDIAVSNSRHSDVRPRVRLYTEKLSGNSKVILDRLLENSVQLPTGYRQRNFGFEYSKKTKRWTLIVTYDFPASVEKGLSKDTIVGVDIGCDAPVVAASNQSKRRISRRDVSPLREGLKKLLWSTRLRRKSILRGGKDVFCEETGRSGHGRDRRGKAAGLLRNKVNNAYTTLNHQVSRAVLKFALEEKAATIQMEDLRSLKSRLTSTVLGETWRYHQLQQYITYKAKEAGIEVKLINPAYTSQRCSKCGEINVKFDAKFRKENREKDRSPNFWCSCGHKSDPDYNAARNIATLGIEDIIKAQCGIQGLKMPS